MSQESQLTFSQIIQLPPTAVYFALTNALPLTEWLCHNAQVTPRIGGHLYLSWNQGYYASGEFIDLEQDQLLSFSWHGRGEAAVTQVNITLEPQAEATQVTLTHTGLGSDDAWDEARDEIAKGWQSSLDNLKSVLETGLDRRIYDRPLLGVLPTGILSAEQAAEQGIPTDGGVQIGGTLPNTGAEAVGLQAGDVITAINGMPVTDFPSLTMAVAPHRADETIKVVFYRNAEVHDVKMVLSRRPVPAVPDTPAELAAALREIYDGFGKELEGIMVGIAPETAVRAATPDAWNSHQILAHLINSERFLQIMITSALEGRILAGLAGNVPAAIDAINTVYPETADVVNAWKKAMDETVVLIAGLPIELTKRKATYLTLGNNILVGFPFHTRAHFREIEQALGRDENH